MKCIAVLIGLLLTLHQSSATGITEVDCDKEFRCHDYLMNKKINKQIKVELEGHYTYLFLAQQFEHHTRYYPKVAKYFRAKAAEELTHAERFIEYQNQRGGNVVMEKVVAYKGGKCGNTSDLLNAFGCAMELEAMVTRELTKLQEDASDLRLNHVKGSFATCSQESSPDIPEDDLRLTQPILVTVAKSDREGHEKETKISDYRNCGCGDDESNCYVVSFTYVELADMIVHEFLGHQLEDTKEIANHYQTLKRMYKNRDSAPLESWLFDKHLEL